MIKKTITIQNKLGLHARASAKFVTEAQRYQSHIDLKRDNKTVNGKSIMGVMMLAASKGTELELIAEGSDEENAVNGLCALVDNKFGEGE